MARPQVPIWNSHVGVPYGNHILDYHVVFPKVVVDLKILKLPSGNPRIPIWYPSGNMQPKGFHANMVLGHNLHHMAPFSILEAGFCMIFRRASFMFSVPGARFGTLGPKNWPGLGLGPFWSKNGGPKKTLFCGRKISPGEITGVP